MEPLFNLSYTRSGLERLLELLDVAYMNTPTHTDIDAFADSQIQRVLKMLNNSDRLPNGTGT